ncbi:MAG: hypothetical protein Q4D36_10820, partial [Bacteroidales bacterium]|nr:hypothetical protein [Bacteroidales bacterium]
RLFQIECLSKDLVEMLMEEFHLTMEEAMDVLYNSQTYAKVENKRTGLFYQSAVYVMDMLQEELKKNAELSSFIRLHHPVSSDHQHTETSRNRQ